MERFDCNDVLLPYTSCAEFGSLSVCQPPFPGALHLPEPFLPTFCTDSTRGSSKAESLPPTKRLSTPWWYWDWSSQRTCQFLIRKACCEWCKIMFFFTCIVIYCDICVILHWFCALNNKKVLRKTPQKKTKWLGPCLGNFGFYSKNTKTPHIRAWTQKNCFFCFLVFPRKTQVSQTWSGVEMMRLFLFFFEVLTSAGLI